MLSILHSPIFEHEIKIAFGLDQGIYDLAVRSGALGLSYFDALDPARRIRRHNLADAMQFAVMLSLGWPVVPANRAHDNAELLCDRLFDTWEQSRLFGEADAEPVPLSRSAADDLTCLVNESFDELFETIHDLEKMSEARKAVLANHVRSVMWLVERLLLLPDDTSEVIVQSDPEMVSVCAAGSERLREIRT